jgi:hypothetical protein
MDLYPISQERRSRYKSQNQLKIKRPEQPKQQRRRNSYHQFKFKFKFKDLRNEQDLIQIIPRNYKEKEDLLMKRNRIISLEVESDKKFHTNDNQNISINHTNDTLSRKQSLLYPNIIAEEVSLIGTGSEVVSSMVRIKSNVLPEHEPWPSTKVYQPTLDHEEEISSIVEEDETDLSPISQERRSSYLFQKQMKIISDQKRRRNSSHQVKFKLKEIPSEEDFIQIIPRNYKENEDLFMKKKRIISLEVKLDNKFLTNDNQNISINHTNDTLSRK